MPLPFLLSFESLLLLPEPFVFFALKAVSFTALSSRSTRVLLLAPSWD